MSDNNTQPLTLVEPQAEEEVKQSEEETHANWEIIKMAFSPLVQAFQSMPKPEHVHGPFTFLLNPNHNALRGCTACGAAWIGLMAGTEENLQWHEVKEPVDSEEEQE